MSVEARAQVRFVSNVWVGGKTKETGLAFGEMLEPSTEVFFSGGAGKSLFSI